MDLIVKGIDPQTSVGTYVACSDVPCGCDCYCVYDICWMKTIRI